MTNQRVDFDVETGNLDRRVRLPDEYRDAKPVLEEYLAERRRAHDDDHDGLREHLDVRLDQMEQAMRESSQVQGTHGKRLDSHDGELRRLHDQQINVLAQNNIILQNFGRILGGLQERMHKIDILVGSALVMGAIGLLLLAGIASKVFR